MPWKSDNESILNICLSCEPKIKCLFVIEWLKLHQYSCVLLRKTWRGQT